MEKDRGDILSPRGVLEACSRGWDSKSISSKSSTSESQIFPTAHSHWIRLFKLWNKSSIIRLAFCRNFSLPRISRRRNKSLRQDLDVELCHIKPLWKNFTLSELQIATNNFSEENLIGKGGFAEVYRGCLPDGQLVAIKQLNKGTQEERVMGFLSEIGIIAHVNHPNTAKLIGYGVEGGTYLVLQLSSKGSLGSLLHGSKEKLDWSIRYKIILGIANGLLYLHKNCQRRIIHRDIKADNILLTETFEPQICDFGLAKWLPEQWTHHNVSKSEGTFGYFAPEYLMYGVVDEKTDVYSFGVLLLELITGRRAVDDSGKSLVLWAKRLLDNDEFWEAVDPFLADNYCQDEMDCVILAASLCIQQAPILRPSMNQVVKLLRPKDDKAGVSKDSERSYMQRTYSQELMDAAEYNSTKNLNQLEKFALAP